MTLESAIRSFLQPIRSDSSLPSIERSLALLADYHQGEFGDLAPSHLRDFLSRHYVEQKSADTTDQIPSPEELMGALSLFFRRAGEKAGYACTTDCIAIIDELEEELPRALELFARLSRLLAERGGAFGFAEFLTSFEEGGRSGYDIDSRDGVRSQEGYFRILRVEGSAVEAEEKITEERVYPIIFPEEVVPLLRAGQIINLDIVPVASAWQIVACGFVYPPGTEL